MFKFKQSLLALAVILVLLGLIPALMPLVSQGQGKGGQKSGSRKFYLTGANTRAVRLFLSAPRASTWPRCGRSSNPRT